jgi:capsular exopolysaccharide synthesis family protein
VKKIDNLNDYEILDVAPGADAVEIHMAYIRAKEALGPESMALYSLMSENEQEEMRLKVETAYKNILDRKSRKKYANRVFKDLDASKETRDFSHLTKGILLKHYGKIIEQISFLNTKVRTVLVASAQSQEGRTTTALGLAYTAALMQPQRRILLMDLDLRNSSLHRLLGLQQSPGLREMISGLNKIKDCLHASPLPNLTVVPSGKEVANIPDILRSGFITQFFKGVTERYDFAFCDSPPVNDYMDITCLSSITDVVLMVIRSKTSRIDEVKHAKEVIHQAGGKVIGAIMNDFKNPIPLYIARHL